MFFFNYFFLIIFILVSVAFFTLLERKLLGYIQYRSGPFKTGLYGFMQPFSDALKLFSSEFFFLSFGNYMIYYFIPCLGLCTSLLFWGLYCCMFNMISFIYGLIFFFCCSGMGVYFIMIGGWCSNSMYSLLGSLRSVAQSISYEVCFFFIILCFVNFVESFNLLIFYFFQSYIWFFFFCFPLFMVVFSCILAETSRSPFDFSEGESELVSGFNVEYSSMSFSLFFLSEYSGMLFLSYFIVIFFVGGDFYSFFFFLKVMVFVYLFIWVRGTFPRYRYDKLMYLSWSCYLPVSLIMFLYILFMKIYVYFIFFSKLNLS